jgi:hypothetical protein
MRVEATLGASIDRLLPRFAGLSGITGICYVIERMALPQVSIWIGGHLTEFRKTYQGLYLGQGRVLAM